MFGPNSSLSPLAKITAFLSAIFLVLSFYLTMQSRMVDESILLEEGLTIPAEEVNPDRLPD